MATLAALLVAVAPFFATVHQALVRHAVCEHGDLIELGSTEFSAERAGGGQLPPPSGRDRGTALWVDETPSGHAHSHCSAGILTRSNATSAARAELVGCIGEDEPPAPADHPVVYGTTILLNAPKTSPPA